MGAVASVLMAFAAFAVSHIVALGGAMILAGAGIACYGRAQEAFERSFREEVVAEIRSHCPSVADEAIEAFSMAAVREFENNRLQWEFYYKPDNVESVHWRFKVQSRRRWFGHPWTVTFVEASYADPSISSLRSAPPPQTRYWEPKAQQLKWREGWKRGILYSPGKEARLLG